ncbi:MAG: endo alpha-1,4 polygalactosaminidase [Candidatus Helarchaeota archaeon]
MRRNFKLILIISCVLIPILVGGMLIFCLYSNNQRDYRQDMRNFIQSLSSYGKNITTNFIIVPQNGQELLTNTGEATGDPVMAYFHAIDGVGREDLFYGYNNDDEATPPAERNYMIGFLDLAETYHIEVLVTDYCSTHSYIDDSYSQNAVKGYISFAADHRDLDNIPAYPGVYNENTQDIMNLSAAQNFLYLLDPSAYPNKSAYLNALNATNYDVLIIDLFYEGQELNATEVAQLQTKANGARRLVLAYMSIGEAEDYRYYWQTSWETNPPDWLAGENPNWPGNYKVRYWHMAWQNIIFGNDQSYMKKILDAGFDGVYLDIVDAFEYFE